MSSRHQARETATRRSEFQPDVFVAAAGALAEVRPARRGVDVVAADAVEGRLPPLAFKPAVIAAVVVQPEPEEKQTHERAKDNRADGEIEHAPSKRSLGDAVKSQPKGSRGTTKNTKAEWGVNREAARMEGRRNLKPRPKS